MKPEYCTKEIPVKTNEKDMLLTKRIMKCITKYEEPKRRKQLTQQKKNIATTFERGDKTVKLEKNSEVVRINKGGDKITINRYKHKIQKILIRHSSIKRTNRKNLKTLKM